MRMLGLLRFDIVTRGDKRRPLEVYQIHRYRFRADSIDQGFGPKPLRSSRCFAIMSTWYTTAGPAFNARRP